jgi:hypothetical protein
MSSPQQSSISRTAAYLAAPLWAGQALVWTVGPKVQEQAAPYRISDTALFELFWLSIAAAVGASALAALAIPAHLGARPTRVVQAASALARVAVAFAGVAAVSIAVAPVPPLQPAALTVMTYALYAAIFALAAGLTLYAVAGWTSASRADTPVLLPSVLAALTIATSVAILASGTASRTALTFAVVVVVLDGAAWLVWGRALASTRQHHHAAAHA